MKAHQDERNNKKNTHTRNLTGEEEEEKKKMKIPTRKKKMDLSFKINMGRDVCAPVLHPTPKHFGFHVKEEEETKNSYLI